MKALIQKYQISGIKLKEKAPQFPYEHSVNSEPDKQVDVLSKIEENEDVNKN